jgi:hypothetical protein
MVPVSTKGSALPLMQANAVRSIRWLCAGWRCRERLVRSLSRARALRSIRYAKMIGPAGFEPTIRKTSSTDFRNRTKQLQISELYILWKLVEARGCYHYCYQHGQSYQKTAQQILVCLLSGC